MLAWGFATPDCQLKMVASRPAVERQIEREPFHIACVDWKMQGEDPGKVLDVLRGRLPQLPVVALLGETERRFAPMLKARGVSATLASPFTIEDLHSIMRAHALPLPVMVPKPETPPAPREPAGGVLLRVMVNDETARRTFELAQRAARSSAAILLLGETGTGKDRKSVV